MRIENEERTVLPGEEQEGFLEEVILELCLKRVSRIYRQDGTGIPGREVGVQRQRDVGSDSAGKGDA